MNFKHLVRQALLSKVELAEKLGLQPDTIYAWKEDPPYYAVAYLKLLIDYNRVRP